MHAVGHVGDRHAVLDAAGPQARPHLARDPPVAAADAVGAAARAQRELGDAELLVEVQRIGPAEPQQLLVLQADLARVGAERADRAGGRVGVVAGRNRCVGREDDPPAGVLQCAVERHAVADRLARELERGERPVSLVQVEDRRVQAERGARADGADAEHRVLRQADLRIPDVQARRRPAGDRRVLGEVRVEQEQRDAPDVHPPDLRLHLVTADRHRDAQRRAVLARDERHRHESRVGLDPVLVLQAADVDALAEVPLAVEQPDADERERRVGGLLEHVACEGAEAAGVDRQRAVNAELGADEGDRLLGADRAVLQRMRRALRVGPARRLELLGPPDHVGVARGALQRGARCLAQQAHGVAAHALPALGVDRCEQFVPAGRP